MSQVANRPPRAWTTTEAAERSGLTARQIHRFVDRGLVVPSIERGTGSGHPSWWSTSDVEHLRRIKDRLDWGMTAKGALRTDEPPPLEPPLRPSDAPTTRSNP